MAATVVAVIRLAIHQPRNVRLETVLVGVVASLAIAIEK